MALSSTVINGIQNAQRALLSPLRDEDATEDWWARVAREVAGVMEASHAYAFRIGPETDGLGAWSLDDAFFRVSETFLEQKQSEWDPGDPPPMPLRVHHVRRQNGSGVYHEREIVSREEVEASPYFQEVCRPHGILNTTGMSVPIPGGEVAVCVAFSSEEAPGFQARASRRLALLLPAFEAGLRHWRRLDEHRDRMGQVIDTIEEPLALVATDGTERHRNPALCRLLEEEPRREELVSALRAFAVDESASPISGGPLCESTRRIELATSAYVLRSTFLRGREKGIGSLLVSVTRQSPFPTVRALRDRFGLTDRQAEVALLLGRGLSNKAVAEELMISPNTVRRHVRAVLLKLGLSSRAAVAYTLVQARRKSASR